jgi:hypothetical protein
MRRLGVATGTVLRGDAATILILPVVRVERHPDEEDEAERPDAGEESAGLPRQRPRR